MKGGLCWFILVARFDILHAGHINFLKKCKDIAGVGDVIVSLNTDEFIEQYKGNPPVFSFEERAELLLSVEYVTDVVANIGGADSRKAIMLVDPDILVIGDDWLVKDYYKQMGFTPEWLQEQEIGLCYVPYTKGISTSEIKRRISES